ncbi:hypothetical protein [Mobilicoccus caccae]|uniref:Uncharacterized protein n=1 Tax=Mobilicoccus caccae TaxID=1859295 RepID=A0ABQ6ILC1_9MICO|nr:hypothetical protein [Mobilicoccus caccae]GMA37993.1 hypothetical protein GCM10025883_00380 [Mobilicoccus caccae]GMA42376.1 hypothetical protein GCM10025883_44210 [Mobilicoccus caccae]GMA42525.1 hypothetical protein GCM10025883_45700 [Mobilicoccus caccae]
MMIGWTELLTMLVVGVVGGAVPVALVLLGLYAAVRHGVSHGIQDARNRELADPTLPRP